MTPLPNPDYYLYNLISMTSSEATRLWRRAVKEHFDNTCVYCGGVYTLDQLTLDHVKPKCKGGETILQNIVPACRCCNQDKGSEHWLDWMRSRFGQIPERENLILSHIS